MVREGNKKVIYEGTTTDWVYKMTHPDTGAARDLTGVTATVSMWKIPSYSMVVTDAACTHGDTDGIITYDTQLADVDEEGEYERQWKLVLAGGEIEYHPDPNIQERDYLKIKRRIESTDTTA